MKRKNFKHWGLFIALQFITLSLFAQGPNNTGTYYQSANGLKGKALKTTMFNIISKHSQLSYDELWTAFKTTDRREDGKVWDMYSDKTNYVSEVLHRELITVKKAFLTTVSILFPKAGLVVK